MTLLWLTVSNFTLWTESGRSFRPAGEQTRRKLEVRSRRGNIFSVSNSNSILILLYKYVGLRKLTVNFFGSSSPKTRQEHWSSCKNSSWSLTTFGLTFPQFIGAWWASILASSCSKSRLKQQLLRLFLPREESIPLGSSSVSSTTII